MVGNDTSNTAGCQLLPIRQTSNLEPCPVCKCAYRRGDYCSDCGAYCPEQGTPDDEGYSREGRPSKGRTWDSKQHKWVKGGS